MQKPDSNIIMTILLVLIGIYFILGKILNIPLSETIFMIIWILLFLIIVVIHGWKTLGFREIIVFFLIAYIITLLYEYTEAGGWGEWFGCRCYYGDLLGPKFLGKIPYIIPLTWSISLYCTFTMTNIIFNRIKTTRESDEKASPKWFLKIFGMGIITGLIMISWDLINDPVLVSMGAWSWPNGGIYYGIPIWNYAVWIEMSAVVFITYNIYLLKVKKNQIYIGGNKRSSYTFLVVILYLMMLLIYGIYAVYEEVMYVIPWATIAMGSAAVITVIQFRRCCYK
ncbi:MAG: carotenoid biosynthesis protein [Thermoplasmatales archaeon]|nr:carotenoid biosynthesis protein [Thermoplasmatales archaeon]